jgi:hypothetical protein
VYLIFPALLITTFLEYAAALTEARNVVGTTAISASIYKYQLLFHSHTVLLLRIMALPNFDIDTISVDDLISLMSMQWESIVTEGIGRSSGRPATLIPTTAATSPAASSAAHTPPPLTDAERTRLTHAGGCWRCRKVPGDPGWVKHVGRMCPGDSAQGISPGRDFVEVKQEIAGAVLLSIDCSGEDQPDTADEDFYPDDETDSD